MTELINIQFYRLSDINISELPPEMHRSVVRVDECDTPDCSGNPTLLALKGERYGLHCEDCHDKAAEEAIGVIL
ncbi:hypothetical protein [Natrinema salifodinae]|uniref:Uncharacterized protein n=1 Tax=Natrinema salifodinae TaxID=1202768 RepID=A0A1I0NAM7_9EURY|nr:hypothetical protein [Natrinema salifodinae]SEV98335.1 hypothetical protein SAMN05216285_1519 [Natrinema salifodinae]